MLNYEQKPSSSTRPKSRLVEPQPKQPDRSRDRTEYLAPTELRTPRLPEETHAPEKVQIRKRINPEEIKKSERLDQERSAQVTEQIRNMDRIYAFEQASAQAFAYTDAVLGPLKEASTEQTLRPETIEAARKKLVLQLGYLREHLQPEGMNLPPSPNQKHLLAEIHFRILGIAQMMNHLDTLSRREEMRVRYAGGGYELRSVKPKEIPDTELGAMAKKWNQKPPEPGTWSKMKSAWKSFWK